MKTLDLIITHEQALDLAGILRTAKLDACEHGTAAFATADEQNNALALYNRLKALEETLHTAARHVVYGW